MKPQIKICKTCGKEFEPKRFNQIYCSPECHYQSQRNNIIYTKICLACGKTFETFYKTQKYCSDSCRIAYNRNPQSFSEKPEQIIKVTKAAKKSKQLKHEEIIQNKKIAIERAHKLRMQRQLEAKQLGYSYGQYIAMIGYNEIGG